MVTEILRVKEAVRASEAAILMITHPKTYAAVTFTALTAALCWLAYALEQGPNVIAAIIGCAAIAGTVTIIIGVKVKRYGLKIAPKFRRIRAALEQLGIIEKERSWPDE